MCSELGSNKWELRRQCSILLEEHSSSSLQKWKKGIVYWETWVRGARLKETKKDIITSWSKGQYARCMQMWEEVLFSNQWFINSNSRGNSQAAEILFKWILGFKKCWSLLETLNQLDRCCFTAQFCLHPSAIAVTPMAHVLYPHGGCWRDSLVNLHYCHGTLWIYTCCFTGVSSRCVTVVEREREETKAWAHARATDPTPSKTPPNPFGEPAHSSPSSSHSATTAGRFTFPGLPFAAPHAKWSLVASCAHGHKPFYDSRTLSLDFYLPAQFWIGLGHYLFRL